MVLVWEQEVFPKLRLENFTQMVVDISTNLSNAGIIALSGVFALVFALLTVFHVTTRKPGVKGVPFPNQIQYLDIYWKLTEENMKSIRFC